MKNAVTVSMPAMKSKAEDRCRMEFIIIIPLMTEQTNNLVGSLISLITNANIRYEGTLVMVDKVERAMHLT